MYRIYKITSDPTVDFAAEELKKYLRMMMPRCGEIGIEYKPDAKEGFRLGLMQDFSLDVSEAPDSELDDMVHIDTDKNGGIIAGDNRRSVLLAVYKYLSLMGCRWLFPGIDGELIPVRDIEPVSYHKLADNRYRGWCNEGAEFQGCVLDAIDFAPKIGLNIFMIECFIPQVYYSWYYEHLHNEANREREPVTSETVLQWKKACEAEIAKRGLQFHDIGHGWTSEPFGMTENDLFEGKEVKIPEESRKYLALIGGKKELHNGNPSHTNICMSNEEGRGIIVRAVADYAELNSHINYLHVWLADGYNNHCECEECVKKSPADWYVMLLNEIDAELTKRELDNHIVFCCYCDTTWPPVTERLNNPARFLLNLGAISRNYTKCVSKELPEIALTEYKRNGIKLLGTVDEYVAYAREWQRRCGMDLVTYEYHFYVNQYKFPDLLSFARVIYNDVKGYNAQGFKGIIEDGTQRPFFPCGFNMFVYASTLFDMSNDFDDLLEDYFSHAYGEDWAEVKEFFAKLGEILDPTYFIGKKSADEARGKYYNPAEAVRMREVYPIIDEFAPFLEAHKNMPKRAQTVAMRMLRRYTEYLRGITEAHILKAFGADALAEERFTELLRDFGKYETEIESYYDQHMMGMAFDSRFYGKLHIMNIGG